MKRQRRKHLRKLSSIVRKRETRHISEIHTLLYKSIFVRYLPKVDDFVMSVDMVLNGTELRTTGVITPESLVEDGIHIITPEKTIDKSMTCRELYLTQADAPNLFSIVKAFYNTIGDLWDSGEEITPYNTPSLTIYNRGKYFSEMDVIELSVINNPMDNVTRRLNEILDTNLNQGKESFYISSGAFKTHNMFLLAGDILRKNGWQVQNLFSQKDGHSMYVSLHEIV